MEQQLSTQPNQITSSYSISDDHSQQIVPPGLPSNFSSIYQTAGFHALAAYHHSVHPNVKPAMTYLQDARTGSPIVDARTNEPLTISKVLCTKPLKSDVSTRPGPGGRQLSYLSGECVTRTLNEIFGYDGWSMDIKQTQREECVKDEKGRYSVTYTATVRLTHKQSGAYKEDCGSGDAIDRNMGQAISNALKASVTDAMKRAARHFGEKLGNSLYGKFNIKQAPNTLQEAVELYEKEQQKIKPIAVTQIKTGKEFKALAANIAQTQLERNRNEIYSPQQSKTENKLVALPCVQNKFGNVQTTSVTEIKKPYNSAPPNMPHSNNKLSINCNMAINKAQQAAPLVSPEEQKNKSIFGKNLSKNANIFYNNDHQQQKQQSHPPPFMNKVKNTYNKTVNKEIQHNSNTAENQYSDDLNFFNFDSEAPRPGTSHGVQPVSYQSGQPQQRVHNNLKRPMEAPMSNKKQRRNPYA